MNSVEYSDIHNRIVARSDIFTIGNAKLLASFISNCGSTTIREVIEILELESDEDLVALCRENWGLRGPKKTNLQAMKIVRSAFCGDEDSSQ